MSLSDVVAALLFVGVVAYAVFGGADFGSGLWDLVAGDARQGAHVRSQIDRSIGPVWEANHVWLIYIFVFLWTGFPTAFAAIMTTLYIPWLFVGLGIVLRGGAFAFRKFSSTVAEARMHGIVFATSSIVTPFFLGMIAGAVASGRVPLEGGDVWTSWTGPTSWVGGLLAVLTCTFLAGTFLAADSARSGHRELAERFGRASMIVGVLTGLVAIAAAIALTRDSPTLAGGLQRGGLALIIISGSAGLVTVWLLHNQRWSHARVGALIAVATIVIGWGAGQYPYILVDEATIDEVIGARPTQVGLVVVFVFAGVTAVPSLAWLYILVNQRSWSEHHSPN